MNAIQKLERPPSAENWSRMQAPCVQMTTRLLYSFAKGGIVWNYNPARNATRYHIEDGIDRATGIRVASLKGNRLGRPYNIELMEAFFDYAEKYPFDGVPAFKGFVERDPLGRGVFIPIRPLAVVRHAGVFEPVFLCPWSSEGLTLYQKRLFMTVLERSIFRLTDFEDAGGRVLLFPKRKSEDGTWSRVSEVWKRGDFQPLCDKEYDEQIRIFFESKKKVAEMLKAE